MGLSKHGVVYTTIHASISFNVIQYLYLDGFLDGILMGLHAIDGLHWCPNPLVELSR